MLLLQWIQRIAAPHRIEGAFLFRFISEGDAELWHRPDKPWFDRCGLVVSAAHLGQRWWFEAAKRYSPVVVEEDLAYVEDRPVCLEGFVFLAEIVLSTSLAF